MSKNIIKLLLSTSLPVEGGRGSMTGKRNNVSYDPGNFPAYPANSEDHFFSAVPILKIVLIT
jgi:hypothetical protein